MKKSIIYLFLLFYAGAFSCKKYLDAKPDTTLATPSTLQDLQGLLDYYNGMNSQFVAGSSIFSDNYFLTYDDWAAIYLQDQKAYYVWEKNDKNNIDWNQAYSNIFTCNLVLESLPKIAFNVLEQDKANSVKGTALFLRASYFYSLAQLFARGYDLNTSSTDPGIPLKLTTDFSEKITRPTVSDDYNRIIADLKKAASLLPVTQSIKSRPSKAAAFGSLARTYLAMQDYKNAGAYADSCLALYNILIDYNLLDSTSPNPIERFNDEVIFQATTFDANPIDPAICKIDSNLYTSYDIDDLRKVILFYDNGDGTYGFKGDYDGGSTNYGHAFTGIVTDEQYLIKAECATRLGNTSEGLLYLNTLLEKRFRAGMFTPFSTTDATQLLMIVLNERRKELLFRGTRWTDLRRLNQDPAFASTLTRELNGTIYTLPPGDAKVCGADT